MLLCDGKHDLESNDTIKRLIDRGYIEECSKGDGPSEWSSLKEYDNYYFPSMNLMITGKCNLNCIHCFNAKDLGDIPNNLWLCDALDNKSYLVIENNVFTEHNLNEQ